jgi:hypothetical protein
MGDAMKDKEDLASGDLSWNPSIDSMLAKWCDQAKCFEWMHTTTYSEYDRKSRAIMIASNVLTAVSGLSNVLTGGIVIDGFQLAWVFGSLSILVSITNVLQDKLAYTSLAAEHTQYAAAWGAIRRKIEEEVGIPPSSRKDCKTFLKYSRQDINTVSIAGNTKIPERIRQLCFDKFSKIPNFDLPDICGEMEHTKVYIKSESAYGTDAEPLIDTHN